MTIIGNVQILTHDIHYGYESGYYVNFTIHSKEDITENQARELLLAHYNTKPIEELKENWEDFMPDSYFDEDLTFGEHSEWASRELELNT